MLHRIASAEAKAPSDHVQSCLSFGAGNSFTHSTSPMHITTTSSRGDNAMPIYQTRLRQPSIKTKPIASAGMLPTATSSKQRASTRRGACATLCIMPCPFPSHKDQGGCDTFSPAVLDWMDDRLGGPHLPVFVSWSHSSMPARAHASFSG